MTICVFVVSTLLLRSVGTEGFRRGDGLAQPVDATAFLVLLQFLVRTVPVKCFHFLAEMFYD